MSKLTAETPATAEAPAVAIPFKVAPVASSAGEAKPNIAQTRTAKIESVVKAGAPFTYDAAATAARPQGDFECICGAKGKNAHVCRDKDGKEVLVGSTCLEHLTDAEGKSLEAPAKERKPRAQAPGLSKQAKFNEALAKYVAPFKYVRKQEGTFTCICGGHGQKQIVVSDANGTEFSVGETCAAQIPGVEVPKPESKRKTSAKVAGLKGSVVDDAPAAAPPPPPDFGQVG
jgi:hypothetical protein